MKFKSISAPKKVFTLVGLIILIFIIAVGLYITSPSASVSSMKDEVSKYLIDGSRVEEESYNTGSCFDVCSSGDAVIEIPETTDFEELFDKYYALIKDNQCEPNEPRKSGPIQYSDSPKENFLKKELDWFDGKQRDTRINSDYLELNCKNQKDWSIGLSFYENGDNRAIPDSLSRDDTTYTMVNRLMIDIQASTR
jgi:hypothetical protein